MRIFVLTHEYHTETYRAGGMAQAFAKIARGLADRGHTVQVFVPAERDETLEDYPRIIVHRFAVRNRLPVRCQAALVWRFPAAIGFYNIAQSACETMRREGRKESPDVVLSASSEMDFFLARDHRWPVVSRISAYWPFCVTCNFEPVYVSTPAGCLSDWMQRQSLSSADMRFAPSVIYQRAFDDLSGRPTQLIRTPMNIIEEPVAWLQVKLQHHLPDNFVLFYGSLQGVKGVHILANALPAILEAHPDLHAVFIGRDRNAPAGGSMADFIRSKLRAYEQRVHFPGIMEHGNAFGALKQARLVVLPSLIDNLPNVLLEAMYFEKLVVGTSDSGIDELLVHEVNGFLVTRNNVAALQDGIMRALAVDDETRAVMGRRARETVMRDCDPNLITQEIEALLGEATKSHCKKAVRRLLSPLRYLWAHLCFGWMVTRLYKWGIPKHIVNHYHQLASQYLPDYDPATGSVSNPTTKRSL